MPAKKDEKTRSTSTLKKSRKEKRESQTRPRTTASPADPSKTSTLYICRSRQNDRASRLSCSSQRPSSSCKQAETPRSFQRQSLSRQSRQEQDGVLGLERRRAKNIPVTDWALDREEVSYRRRTMSTTEKMGAPRFPQMQERCSGSPVSSRAWSRLSGNLSRLSYAGSSQTRMGGRDPTPSLSSSSSEGPYNQPARGAPFQATRPQPAPRRSAQLEEVFARLHRCSLLRSPNPEGGCYRDISEPVEGMSRDLSPLIREGPLSLWTNTENEVLPKACVSNTNLAAAENFEAPSPVPGASRDRRGKAAWKNMSENACSYPWSRSRMSTVSPGPLKPEHDADRSNNRRPDGGPGTSTNHRCVSVGLYSPWKGESAHSGNSLWVEDISREASPICVKGNAALGPSFDMSVTKLACAMVGPNPWRYESEKREGECKRVGHITRTRSMANPRPRLDPIRHYLSQAIQRQTHAESIVDEVNYIRLTGEPIDEKPDRSFSRVREWVEDHIRGMDPRPRSRRFSMPMRSSNEQSQASSLRALSAANSSHHSQTRSQSRRSMRRRAPSESTIYNVHAGLSFPLAEVHSKLGALLRKQPRKPAPELTQLPPVLQSGYAGIQAEMEEEEEAEEEETERKPSAKAKTAKRKASGKARAARRTKTELPSLAGQDRERHKKKAPGAKKKSKGKARISEKEENIAEAKKYQTVHVPKFPGHKKSPVPSDQQPRKTPKAAKESPTTPDKDVESIQSNKIQASHISRYHQQKRPLVFTDYQPRRRAQYLRELLRSPVRKVPRDEAEEDKSAHLPSFLLRRQSRSTSDHQPSKGPQPSTEALKSRPKSQETAVSPEPQESWQTAAQGARVQPVRIGSPSMEDRVRVRIQWKLSKLLQPPFIPRLPSCEPGTTATSFLSADHQGARRQQESRISDASRAETAGASQRERKEGKPSSSLAPHGGDGDRRLSVEEMQMSTDENAMLHLSTRHLSESLNSPSLRQLSAPVLSGKPRPSRRKTAEVALPARSQPKACSPTARKSPEDKKSRSKSRPRTLQKPPPPPRSPPQRMPRARQPKQKAPARKKAPVQARATEASRATNVAKASKRKSRETTEASTRHERHPHNARINYAYIKARVDTRPPAVHKHKRQRKSKAAAKNPKKEEPAKVSKNAKAKPQSLAKSSMPAPKSTRKAPKQTCRRPQPPKNGTPPKPPRSTKMQHWGSGEAGKAQSKASCVQEEPWLDGVDVNETVLWKNDVVSRKDIRHLSVPLKLQPARPHPWGRPLERHEFSLWKSRQQSVTALKTLQTVLHQAREDGEKTLVSLQISSPRGLNVNASSTRHLRRATWKQRYPLPFRSRAEAFDGVPSPNERLVVSDAPESSLRSLTSESNRSTSSLSTPSELREEEAGPAMRESKTPREPTASSLSSKASAREDNGDGSGKEDPSDVERHASPSAPTPVESQWKDFARQRIFSPSWLSDAHPVPQLGERVGPDGMVVQSPAPEIDRGHFVDPLTGVPVEGENNDKGPVAPPREVNKVPLNLMRDLFPKSVFSNPATPSPHGAASGEENTTAGRSSSTGVSSSVSDVITAHDADVKDDSSKEKGKPVPEVKTSHASDAPVTSKVDSHANTGLAGQRKQCWVKDESAQGQKVTASSKVVPRLRNNPPKTSVTTQKREVTAPAQEPKPPEVPGAKELLLSDVQFKKPLTKKQISEIYKHLPNYGIKRTRFRFSVRSEI